jgi:Meiotically up-regulated gene 113
VEVFIDDLFLCPKCGTFTLVDLGSDDLGRLGIKIEGKLIRTWPTQFRVTSECARQIRQFCQSRLGVKEFLFKECDDAKVCETVRAYALSRRDYRTKRSKEQLQFPEPIPDIKTVRKPEQLPWDEGYVYLVRCGGFYKIGLAKDANKRLSGLKTSSPFEIEMVKTWRCKRPDTIERTLHEQFEKFRVRGEWFQFTEDVLQALLNLQDLNKEFPSDETE